MLFTKKEKYGEGYNKIVEKTKNTTKERYGVDNVFQLKSTKDKSYNSIIKKVKENNSDLSFIDIKPNNYVIQWKKGHSFDINRQNFFIRSKLNIKLCTVCNPLHSFIKSGMENDVLDFIKNNYNNSIIENDKIILEGKELDIYLPDLKLAFEFNGLYWDNELYKTSNYHKEKTDKCLSKEINLIQIYEDDWIFKKDIIKSIILNKLNKTPNVIFGRKTVIKEVDIKISKNFLDNNHLQSFVSASIRIGLFYENELVSLMTLGKLRKSMNLQPKENQYEMIRFCNKLNTTVVGGRI